MVLETMQRFGGISALKILGAPRGGKRRGQVRSAPSLLKSVGTERRKRTASLGKKNKINKELSSLAASGYKAF
jgi:hypothetical protein